MNPVTITLGAMLLSVAASQAMAQVSQPDQKFAKEAATGGQAEVTFGQLAESNAGSAEVRQFGQRMVIDHSQVNAALEEIARSQHLSLPTGLASQDLETERRLRELKGDRFDATYMNDMVQDHRQDIATFQQEVKNGDDRELRAFAAKYLPVLQQHLEMAEADDPERPTPNR